MKTALCVLSIFLSVVSVLAQNPTSQELKVVPNVDLQKYSGACYEIARLPNRFQNMCESDVTATYIPDGDELIVTNRCRINPLANSGEHIGNSLSQLRHSCRCHSPRKKFLQTQILYCFVPRTYPLHVLHKISYGHVDLQFAGMGDKLEEMESRYRNALVPPIRWGNPAHRAGQVRKEVWSPLNVWRQL